MQWLVGKSARFLSVNYIFFISLFGHQHLFLFLLILFMKKIPRFGKFTFRLQHNLVNKVYQSTMGQWQKKNKDMSLAYLKELLNTVVFLKSKPTRICLLVLLWQIVYIIDRFTFSLFYYSLLCINRFILFFSSYILVLL